METKNDEFFENIFPLKVEYEGSSKKPLEISCEYSNENLRRSKKNKEKIHL